MSGLGDLLAQAVERRRASELAKAPDNRCPNHLSPSDDAVTNTGAGKLDDHWEAWDFRLRGCECSTGKAEVIFVYEQAPGESPYFSFAMQDDSSGADDQHWEADVQLTRRQVEAFHAALGAALERSK